MQSVQFSLVVCCNSQETEKSDSVFTHDFITLLREGGRERGREGGREEEREGGREGGREDGRG